MHCERTQLGTSASVRPNILKNWNFRFYYEKLDSENLARKGKGVIIKKHLESKVSARKFLAKYGYARKRAVAYFKKKKNQHKIRYSLLIFIIFILGSLSIGFACHTANQNRALYLKEQQNQTTRKSLSEAYKERQKLDKLLTNTKEQLRHKKALEARNKAKIEKLNRALQAKAEAKKRALASAQVVTVPEPVAAIQPKTYEAPVSSGCGDNFYAHFIYMKESGCRTTAVNPIGCYGIGQACPASKIAHCGADYACQNAWFTNYANSAYGGWAGAYSFWLSHSWW